MDQNKIAEFLVFLRKNKGVNQIDIASFLGVSNKTISKWETGHAVPDTFYLPLLSNYYNVSIEELLNGEYSQNNTNYKQFNISIHLSLINILIGIILLFLTQLLLIRDKTVEVISVVVLIGTIISFVGTLFLLIQIYKSSSLLKLVYLMFLVISIILFLIFLLMFFCVGFN